MRTETPPKRVRHLVGNCCAPEKQPRGFTLIELLVVISVISVLTGILVPSLNRVRQQARRLLGTNNQRQIVNAVNFFASDNDHLYPQSVATIGTAQWNWAEPMMLTSRLARSARVYRSVGAYLRPYIQDAATMHCPSAPLRYEYLQDVWDAGDDWDNPQTPFAQDSVSGTYCLYWNYTGFLQDRSYLFKGPRNTAGGRGQSGLLVSDYFGYGHHRSDNSYGSCEKFPRAEVAEGTVLSSDYWRGYGVDGSSAPAIELHAGYTDGHVERYLSSDTLGMRVIRDTATGAPYLPGNGSPGEFFLPRTALR